METERRAGGVMSDFTVESLTPAQAMIARTMTETELQSNIIDLAHTLGYLVHHSRPAINRRGQWSTAIEGDPGLPDLILAKGGLVWFVECKREKGQLSEYQLRWRHHLRYGYYCLWRPSDWLNGTIEATLRG